MAGVCILLHVDVSIAIGATDMDTEQNTDMSIDTGTDTQVPDLELAPRPTSPEVVSQSVNEEAASMAQSSLNRPSIHDEKTQGNVSEYRLEDTTVTGEQRTEATSASHYSLEIGTLRVIPRKNVAEQLMLAPGVLTTNHGGEGHAQETYMRGFASNEGQDIAFLVDGIPLNEVSNPHNHGYTDLYFIPPELVQSVAVTEGAFDPEQGDFAFAGTAEYKLGAPEKGANVSLGLGRWNTRRTLFTWAPKEENSGTFGGFEYYTSDGYGVNRAAQRVLALGRFTDDWEGQNFTYGISVYGYAARFDQPGVVREDDYENGIMEFFDTYDPNQGGESNRILTSFDLTAGPERSQFKQVVFAGLKTMRLRTNFTGWFNDSLVDENGETRKVQRGDGMEMRYKVVTAGARGKYTLTESLFDQKQSLAVGYAIRLDTGSSEQLRLRSVTAIPYGQVFDNDFTVVNVAGWFRAQIRMFHRLTLRSGLRLDVFSFGVTDQNQADSDREGIRVPNQTSQSMGFSLNPRATVDMKIIRGLHGMISYGQGTRSTDAAALSDNETAPFARAQEFDAGFAYTYGKEQGPLKLSSQLSYSLTRVDKDLVFSETDGRNILAGASTRHAILFGVRSRIISLFDVLLNAGWTQATLDSTGELLPYIPRMVVRADVAISGQIGNLAIKKVPMTGSFGLGYTWVPGRPLPLDEKGDAMYLLNAGGDIRLWHFSLGVEIRNLFNLKYRQAEFNYASNFMAADAAPSRVPERHFVAGEPFYLMGTLTLHLEDLFHSIKDMSNAERE